MIRPFVPDDFPAVRKLLETGLKEIESHAANCSPPEDRGFFDSELAEHLSGLESVPQNWFVITNDSDQTIGCMWLKFLEDKLGPYTSVRELIVDDKFRNQGFGGALLSFAIQVARHRRSTMILISGFRSNPALRLYRRHGFIDFPDEHRLDKNPEHVVLWIEM